MIVKSAVLCIVRKKITKKKEEAMYVFFAIVFVVCVAYLLSCCSYR